MKRGEVVPRSFLASRVALRCVAALRCVGARERKVVRAVNISLYRPRRRPRLPRTSIGSAVPTARVGGERACRANTRAAAGRRHRRPDRESADFSPLTS